MKSAGNVSAAKPGIPTASSAPREPGAEALPGYRLIELLGRGGFGEVWKCEAPGGILKAIKFIKGTASGASADTAQAVQEFNALKRIISIRHPFILSMDRIEQTGDELLIVMELADRTLFDLFQAYRGSGYAGIPRDELIGYMTEVAEALDLMFTEHNLQHLDIKPGNLFLVSNHVKVADFGLVSDLGTRHNANDTGELANMTPLYVAPEVLTGKVSSYSDQYSLAIVYQELLTGTLPFNGKSARQLAMQHMMAEPNLEAVPVKDKVIVAKALAKEPSKRFPSCMSFVQALITGDPNCGSASRGDIRTSRFLKRVQGLETQGDFVLEGQGDTASDDGRRTGQAPRAAQTGRNPGAPATGYSPLAPRTGLAPAVPSRLQPATLAPEGLRRTASMAGETPAPPLALSAEEQLLPGYQFLDCIGRNPLGETWKVVGPDGRRYLVKMVSGFEGADPQVEGRNVTLLASIKHQGLLQGEVLYNGPGHLALVNDLVETTLWDQFQQHRSQRLPGLDRHQLLGYLREVAETLDDLFDRFELMHLALTPRNIYLPERDAALVGEFGLVQLLWANAKQPLGPLNPRYGAYELSEEVITRSADVFSLALVYAEMLTGVHPLKKAMTGNRNRANAKIVPDLDLFNSIDRPILAKALHSEPDLRFQSCMELIEALEKSDAALAGAVSPEMDALPAVGSVGSSADLPATPTWFDVPVDPRGPDPRLVILDLVNNVSTPWPLESLGGIRFFHRPGEAIVHRCGAMLHAGLAQAKLDGFRQAVGAVAHRQEDNLHVFHIMRQRSLWQSMRGQQPGLEVSVRLLRPQAKSAMLTEVMIQITPFDMQLEEAKAALREVGPKVLVNLRTYLQATSERRAHERYELTAPVNVAPVFPRNEVGEMVACHGKDISFGGLSFYAPYELPTPQVLLQLSGPTAAAPIPVPAYVIRSQPCVEGGWFEVGVKFLVEIAPPT